MVSTAEIMERMKNKSNSPKARFKPLSAQRGLTEMFKPQLITENEKIEANSESAKKEHKKNVNGSQSKSEYDEKIKELEAMLLKERSKNSRTSVNEEKVLNVIRSEAMAQNCIQPIITRSMFLKKYKINSRYLDDSINKLLEKKSIIRESVKYSAKVKTHSWKIQE